MKWLNIELVDLRKPEFVGASDEQKGVWLAVVSWCAAVENGGKIVGARAWNALMWLQTCGVRPALLKKSCALWSWEGEDLVIWNYPNGKEDQVKAGRTGGNTGGRPKKHNPPENPSDNPDGNPKGREWKGIGKEGEGNGRDRVPPVLSPEEWANLIHPLFSGRRDGELECKAAIAADIAAGQDPLELERNVRLIVGYIEARAPGGWANAFIPRGVKFWLERQWRNPEAFAQRWDDPKKNKGGPPNQTPAVAVRFTTHRELPEPPCDWRRVMREMFPPDEYPAADFTLPWGLYEPDVRNAVLLRAMEQGLLGRDWKQPPPPAVEQ